MQETNGNTFWTRKEIDRLIFKTDKIEDKVNCLDRKQSSTIEKINSIEKKAVKIEERVISIKNESMQNAIGIRDLNWKIVIIVICISLLGGGGSSFLLKMLLGV